MLQQTQVTTVIPYYHRFLEHFSDLYSLAGAPESEVLTLWSGLGYYSRARNLRRGARFLVEKHGGRFPRTREEILKVPGIGPYTAGAILSIAFGLREPLVDGNVQRVLARYFLIESEIGSRDAQAFFWGKAEEAVRACDDPRDLNQALMELGATICVKGQPFCKRCPWSASCGAHRAGRETELPRKKARRKTEDLYWAGLVFEANGMIFLRQNHEGEWWKDLWDFPRIEARNPREICQRFTETVRELGPDLPYVVLGEARHTVTHHRIHLTPYLVRIARARVPYEGRWFTHAELQRLAVSSLVRKVVTQLC
jgi:A/G-specific adenine glycosylase